MNDELSAYLPVICKFIYHIVTNTFPHISFRTLVITQSIISCKSHLTLSPRAMCHRPNHSSDSVLSSDLQATESDSVVGVDTPSFWIDFFSVLVFVFCISLSIVVRPVLSSFFTQLPALNGRCS